MSDWQAGLTVSTGNVLKYRDLATFSESDAKTMCRAAHARPVMRAVHIAHETTCARSQHPMPPAINDMGSYWRVDHAEGPATFYTKRVYPTRDSVRVILDACPKEDLVIWPSAGQETSSRL